MEIVLKKKETYKTNHNNSKTCRDESESNEEIRQYGSEMKRVFHGNGRNEAIPDPGQQRADALSGLGAESPVTDKPRVTCAHPAHDCLS